MTRLGIALVFCAAAMAATAHKLLPFDETSYHRLIAANRGNVVLLDFWATWCAPCREEMPVLVKLESKLRSKGFRLITISADEPEQETEAAQFLKQHGVTGPAYLKRVSDDEKFINAIDPKWSGALPALFLFDRRGNKVGFFTGETSQAEIEKAILKLL